MLIGLVGRKQAGKDATAQRLVAEHGFVRVAFADRMRDALLALDPIATWEGGEPVYLSAVVGHLGWDTAKERFPEVRRLLQRFGTEMGRAHFGADFWLDLAWVDVVAIRDEGRDVVVTDCRFRNEIGRLWRDGGRLWRIERLGLPPEDPDDPLMQHASEQAWRSAWADQTLSNPGDTLEQYWPVVDEAVVRERERA